MQRNRCSDERKMCLTVCTTYLSENNFPCPNLPHHRIYPLPTETHLFHQLAIVFDALRPDQAAGRAAAASAARRRLGRHELHLTAARGQAHRVQRRLALASADVLQHLRGWPDGGRQGQLGRVRAAGDWQGGHVSSCVEELVLEHLARGGAHARTGVQQARDQVGGSRRQLRRQRVLVVGDALVGLVEGLRLKRRLADQHGVPEK